MAAVAFATASRMSSQPAAARQTGNGFHFETRSYMAHTSYAKRAASAVPAAGVGRNAMIPAGGSAAVVTGAGTALAATRLSGKRRSAAPEEREETAAAAPTATSVPTKEPVGKRVMVKIGRVLGRKTVEEREEELLRKFREPEVKIAYDESHVVETRQFRTARSQPKDPQEEKRLAQKYAAIEDIGDRAFQILVDLGMVQPHGDVDDQ
jgi:hypothetical protein